MEYVVICMNLMNKIVNDHATFKAVQSNTAVGTIFGPFDRDEALSQQIRHNSECEHNHIILNLTRG